MNEFVTHAGGNGFPDLRRAGIVALDLETHDAGLDKGLGSSWPWGDGHICGVSVAWREGNDKRARYFPIRHPETDNFDRDQLFAWLQDLTASDVRFATQNGIYDWGWLRTEAGIVMPPAERLEEIGALATIVDENRQRYGLSDLCKWRGIPGKDETLLREGVVALGLGKNVKPQTVLYKLPARFVAPYAEADAAATLALFENLAPILDRENTRAAYRLEVDLLPMVLEMRRRGIRINQNAAEQARDQILLARDATLVELSTNLGTQVGMSEIRSPRWLKQTFDLHAVSYESTKKGNPSFTSDWMEDHPHWLPQLISKAKRHDHYANTFIEGHILGHVINGRVYAEINPHRSEDGGTRTSRFSYKNPPLQQMPKHDKELAPKIRRAFLPEDGELWLTADISQQEFRLVVSYAELLDLPGAKEAADRYRENPDTDYHNFTMEMVGNIVRQDAKQINFAKMYGMGVVRLAQELGKTVQEARELVARYDHALPFIPRLANFCKREADRQGYTELYDGAPRHYGLQAVGVSWEKAWPCSAEEAQHRVNDPEHPWHRRRLCYAIRATP
jgi:DNA polymerase I-like protein with 3'-5' exonuclease and polymerase domains